MSMQLDTLSAPAGTNIGVGYPVGSRLSQFFKGIVRQFQAWVRLQKQFVEIQALSDRELIDIGLDQGEIQRLRHGEVFCPQGWTPTNRT